VRPVPRSSAQPGRRDIHLPTALQGSYPVPLCTRKYLDGKGTCGNAFACTRAPRGTAFTLPPPYHVHAPSSPGGNQPALSLQGSHHRVAHRVAHRVTPSTIGHLSQERKRDELSPGRDDALLASATRQGLGETPHGILRPAVAEMQTPKSRYRVATLYPVSISIFTMSAGVTLYLPCRFYIGIL